MTYNTKNWKRKNNKDMDYNNSSRQFRPLGSRLIALSIKCYSLALRTESREEFFERLQNLWYRSTDSFTNIDFRFEVIFV